jgi:hypothetical protein
MSSTCGLGGAGIASSNNASYLLNRRAKPPTLVPMFVDTAGDDDKSRVGADEYAIDVSEGAGTRLELHTSNARALLTRISKGRAIDDFKHISPGEAERLLQTLAADKTGSGEQPLVTALALHPVPHQLREAAQRFVSGARAVKPDQPPILGVPSALGGGAGPGSLPPVVRVLRELAPDATIVVILMGPGAWFRFGADRVAHMNAKSIAALLAVSARQASASGANLVYLLGTGSGAYPDALPTEGVCAVAGEYIAQIATHPLVHQLDFANVVQQITPQAPFATLGAARVDLLAIDRGERLAHTIAVAALDLTLELEPVDAERGAGWREPHRAAGGVPRGARRRADARPRTGGSRRPRRARGAARGGDGGRSPDPAADGQPDAFRRLRAVRRAARQRGPPRRPGAAGPRSRNGRQAPRGERRRGPDG